MARSNITEMQLYLAIPNFNAFRSITPLAPHLPGPPRLPSKETDCRYHEHHLDLPRGRLILDQRATADNRSAEPRISQGICESYISKGTWDIFASTCSAHIRREERTKCRNTARTFIDMLEALNTMASTLYTFPLWTHQWLDKRYQQQTIWK